MIFRGLDENNDWQFGCGKSSYVVGIDAIMTNITTKLRTFFGECFFDPTVGVNWFSLINEKNKTVVVLSIRSEIMACDGVIGINEVEYSCDVSRTLKIKYNINTISGNYVEGTVII